MRSESVRFVRKWEGNCHYGYTDADAFTIAGQAILQKKNSCKCRSWMVGGGARS